jgi:hypothetical protein
MELIIDKPIHMKWLSREMCSGTMHLMKKLHKLTDNFQAQRLSLYVLVRSACWGETKPRSSAIYAVRVQC